MELLHGNAVSSGDGMMVDVAKHLDSSRGRHPCLVIAVRGVVPPHGILAVVVGSLLSCLHRVNQLSVEGHVLMLMLLWDLIHGVDHGVRLDVVLLSSAIAVVGRGRVENWTMDERFQHLDHVPVLTVVGDLHGRSVQVVEQRGVGKAV